ncbi:hypothetical protein [Terracoccus sp. 273MFTsu3.1]|uniref:hypothetical protein n=1 Tax=Terracoccus sp. 273MFTsu3.1 TaxID=1172188 RepID=UPI0005B8A5F4|nr:hypothetical protein [Terracoccus sp. 273MFTsu3.1]
MTRMVIGDDLSPHFIDDGPQRDRCDFCGRVAVDHDYGMVIEGPTGRSSEDDEGQDGWGHVHCIEQAGLTVVHTDDWSGKDDGIHYEDVREVEPDFDYDEFYGRKGR